LRARFPKAPRQRAVTCAAGVAGPPQATIPRAKRTAIATEVRRKLRIIFTTPRTSVCGRERARSTSRNRWPSCAGGDHLGGLVPDRDHPFPGRTTADTGLVRCRIPGGSGELLEVRAPSGNARRRNGGLEPAGPAPTPSVSVTRDRTRQGDPSGRSVGWPLTGPPVAVLGLTILGAFLCAASVDARSWPQGTGERDPPTSP
jgi:hypothetical protein